MRANSPTDNDLSVLNPVVDETTPSEKVSREHIELAKAAKAPAGKIILDHLQERIDDYTNTLKNSNFADKSPEQTAVSVMTAQAVIKEFESVLRDVEISKNVVKDA